MKFIFLGTGTSQGIPVIGCECEVCLSGSPLDKRLRTSAYVEIKDTRILIDIGPDFRQQALVHDITDLQAILLTHQHNDHIIGMDDIRPINFKQRRDMPVYGRSDVLREVQQRFSYVFEADPYPGAPRLEPIRIEGLGPFDCAGIEVQPVLLEHGNIPVLGYIFEKRLAYLTDMKTISDEEIKKVERVDILILNALHHRPHHSHLNLSEALALIERIRPQTAYLTHLSHQMGKHEVVEKQLPDEIHLAYDGLTLHL